MDEVRLGAVRPGLRGMGEATRLGAVATRPVLPAVEMRLALWCCLRREVRRWQGRLCP